MSTIRIANRRRFTTIISEALEDTRLSFRARGVLAWLLSKPDGWKINADNIAQEGTEGRDAILTALKELEIAGYLRRERVQMPGGTWHSRSMLYESPSPEKPTSAEPTSVNQGSKDLILKAKTESKTDSDRAFNEFWNAYPATRRGGIPSAKKAWKKIDPDEYLSVMLGLSLSVAYWKKKKTEPEFIKLAASWLNDRRWENPPEVKTPPPPLPKDPKWFIVELGDGFRRNTMTGELWHPGTERWEADPEWVYQQQMKPQ